MHYNNYKFNYILLIINKCVVADNIFIKLEALARASSYSY